MLFMVIETIKADCDQLVFDRFHEKGRLLPDGLIHIDSWLEDQGDRCFKLLETNDASLFDQWTPLWADLLDFEFIMLSDKCRNTAS